jgi:hypothetical protein
MRLLKTLISFVVATIVGALGNQVFGAFGMVLGFVAGGVVAWWVVRRLGY